MRLLRPSLILLLMLLAGPALAWWDDGHRVVAMVAERDTAPETRQWIKEVLSHHPDPVVRDLQEAALWPDRVRRHPKYAQPTWHYINYPVFIDIPQGDEGPEVPALRALNQCTRVLKDPTVSGEERALALCWIAHIIGDLHQPLHVCTGYSAEFPEGDRGGTRLLVKVGTRTTNLHALWDSAGGLFWDGANKHRLPSLVDGLILAYPKTPGQELTLAQWLESTRLEGREIYTSSFRPRHQQALPAEALTYARTNAPQDLTEAGYHLAGYLDRIRQAQLEARH